MNGIINDPNTIKFPALGWEFKIDPTAFTIGGFQVQWYGIIIALGLLLAVLYCFPRMKRFGIDSDRAADAVIGGVIGGIIGARLYYVIMKWDEYRMDTLKDTFLAVINTRNGGLAIYGGLIGAVAVGLLMCKIRKVKMLPMLDVAGIGFLIGQGIGRWGNFVNQEAFGTNTDFVLGMTGGRIQSIASVMPDMAWDKPVHPCFFYESVWCLLGFVLLAFWAKRRKYDGQIFLMYLGWYGLERAVVEGLRTDSLMVGNIRISQALSIVLVIVSFIVQLVMFFRRKRDPESFVLYASTEESILLIEESRRKRMGIKGADAAIMGDDDDEIGILADDDDDEIGELPDEDDDDEEDAAEVEESEETESVEEKSEETESEVEESEETKSEEEESEDAESEEEKSEEAESEEEKSEETESEEKSEETESEEEESEEAESEEESEESESEEEESEEAEPEEEKSEDAESVEEESEETESEVEESEESEPEEKSEEAESEEEKFEEPEQKNDDETAEKAVENNKEDK